MLEIKITASELAEAINNLAKALSTQTAEPTPAIMNTLAQKPAVPVPQPVPNIPAQQPVPTAPVPQPPIQPTQPVQVQQPIPIPTAAPQYTLDMLSRAGASLADSGKRDQLIATLQKYGVNNLTALPPEQYGALANDLRALGAVI